MSEMRNRLKAALRLRSAKHGEPMEADHPLWDDLIDGVWATMREPDAAIRDVAASAWDAYGADGKLNLYRDMVDAALAEGEA